MSVELACVVPLWNEDGSAALATVSFNHPVSRELLRRLKLSIDALVDCGAFDVIGEPTAEPTDDPGEG